MEKAYAINQDMFDAVLDITSSTLGGNDPIENKIVNSILEKLIELVRQNPPLYDVSRKDYKDALKNTNIWASIAATLQEHGLIGDFRKTRWRTLRDTFVRKKREMKLKRSGSCAANGKRWKFMDIMQFLDGFTEEHSTESNLDVESQETEDNKPEDSPHGSGDSDEDEFSDSGFPDEEDRSSSISVLPKSASTRPSLAVHSTSLSTRTSSPSPSFTTSSTPRTSTQRNREKRNSDDTGIEKAIIDLCTSTKQRRENPTQTKDEDESFLQSFYYRLKNLPKDIKGVVQLQMAQIFFNAENTHLPPQPIMPLPRQYAQSSHTHTNPPLPVYREYSSNMAGSDIVAMAMQELN
ncbi:uncharacterized protein LOC135481321 [Liolophura sinensis]|uniref:uncharacterized protein LOC135481321 n=1 Tax=Liolophura sinensis TaxID=3198878 RepID=UPI003157FE33